MQKAVCFFKVPSVFFPTFHGHIGLDNLQKLNGQIAQLYQAWRCEPKAPGLHVIPKYSQMYLNELVTGILDLFHSKQTVSSLRRTNKGIYMVHLQP